MGFERDLRGRRLWAVNLATQAPREGSWTSANAMGFIWSMALDEHLPPQRYQQRELEPARVILEATVAGSLVATADLERRFVGPGVTRTDIREGVWLRLSTGRPKRPAGTVRRYW